MRPTGARQEPDRRTTGVLPPLSQHVTDCDIDLALNSTKTIFTVIDECACVSSRNNQRPKRDNMYMYTAAFDFVVVLYYSSEVMTNLTECVFPSDRV